MPTRVKSLCVREQIATLHDGGEIELVERHYARVQVSTGRDYRFGIESDRLILRRDSINNAIDEIEREEFVIGTLPWVAVATTNVGAGMRIQANRFSVGDLISVGNAGLYGLGGPSEVSLGMIVDVLL